MNYESERVQRIKASPSMAISLQAKAMRATGINVIDLSLGEPDFDTPTHIVDAAERAMRNGQTRYTAADGTPELKAAIVQKFQRENGLTFAQNEVSVANGAKQSIFNALQATLEPGDEVVIPAPYWVSYSDMVTLLGGTPVPLECGAEHGFLVSGLRLAQSITPKTRWVILNSPSNPSGAIYSQEQWAELGAVLAKFPRVLIMSDEIYEHIIYDQPFVSFGNACPQLRDRTLLVNGVSKTYAMTGWRIGYAAGPQGLISAMGKIQSQSTSNPCSIAQAAAVEALNGPQAFLAPMVAEYKARRDLVVGELAKISGLEIINPPGAFYAFPRCSSYFGMQTPDGEVINNDTDLSAYLLRRANVATVPGAAFGLSSYIRLSFATSQPVLADAMQRIKSALDELVIG
ncbi:MAG: pyridoxal phosphate-dependent aminotransferase [Burkholderiaceae bacterium]|nr:pyridoxal phosphate-dependent aminotransferase [Burkholderiaceae bacterium]